ncbi:fasciclin domain-containing protein [Falsiroseomonas sp.]|uniref:fasciclin domain-containing protein n=1 Tax=Falsiroseomonas sp. TaxID=2870721 RepID=UPI0027208A57|nr:fasciclin domain-containing protein [Falsiroseomonas sp.]MDO9501931.1 fasciclin domain-containing protein [Falsiroseomonas sp.]MDP3418175.1 fasciclin domain-containing protein [Falsiroseomonas sp.]
MIRPSMPRRGFMMIGGLAAAGSLAAPGVLRAQSVPPTATLADTMAADSRFSRFLDLITRAGMVEDFRSAQPLTVFAPTDAAFAGAPANLLQQLLGTSSAGGSQESVDRQRLGALINYHIVPGAFRASELMGTERRLRTRNGADISITGTAESVQISNPAPAQQIAGFGAAGANVNSQPARVVSPNIVASNGVIHAVDQLMWP